MGAFGNNHFGAGGLGLSGLGTTLQDAGGGSLFDLGGENAEDSNDGSIIDNRPFINRLPLPGRVPADPGGSPTAPGISVPSVTNERVGTPYDAFEKQTFVEDNDRTDNSGGSSDETEILGDDETLKQINTRVVYGIQDSMINEQGFIDNLAFEIKDYNLLGGNLRTNLQARDNSNVFIFVERYRVPSAGAIIRDYIPTTDMTGFRVLQDTRISYSQQERESLREVLGSKKLTSIDISSSMGLIFGSLSLGTENFLEDSIFTNRIESTKKLKLTSFSSNTPTPPSDGTPPSQSSGLSSRTPARQGPAAPTATGKAPIQRSRAPGASYQSAGKPSSSKGSSY